MSRPDDTHLHWRGRRWTKGDLARLLVREGGHTAEDAARATGLSRSDVGAVTGDRYGADSPALHETLRYVEAEEAVVSADVADRFGISRVSANQRLRTLHRVGLLVRERPDPGGFFVYTPRAA